MTVGRADRTRPRPRTVRWGDVIVSSIGILIAAILFAGSAAMEVRGQAVPGPRFFPVIVGVLLTATSGFLLLRAAIPAKRVAEHEELLPDVSRELLIDVSHTGTQLIDLERAHRAETAAAATAAGTEGADAAAGPASEPGAGAADPVAPIPAAPGDPDPSSDIDGRALGIAVAAVAGFIVILPLLGWILSCALLFASLTLAFGSRRLWFNLAIGILIGSIVQLVFHGLLGLALPVGVLGGIF